MRWTWMAVLALVSGCDGINLEQLVQQHGARSRVAEEPAGEHCPHGGQALQTGLDLNDNGVLDDSEVTSTDYVCANPDDVLVLTRQVPEGAQCPHGGQVTHAGRDLNGNGQLEDSEITREVYGCREEEAVISRRTPLPSVLGGCPLERTLVEAGLDSNGDGVLDPAELQASTIVCIPEAQSRLRQRAEAPGTQCTAGGTVVDVGTDLNSDGTLGDEEVSTSIYVCQLSASFQGDYTVRNTTDLLALQGISRIRGNLLVRNTTLQTLSLPGLVTVDGDLTLDFNGSMTRADLPGLRYVAGNLSVTTNLVLTQLVLGPSQTSQLLIGKSLLIQGNALLPDLKGLPNVLPQFSFYLTNNASMQDPGTLPLINVLTGSAIVSDNAALTKLPLSNLQHVHEEVNIVNNDALQSLSGLVLLRTVNGNVNIVGNDALPRLAGLTNLEYVGEGLSVESNNQLRETGELRRLTRVGGLSFRSNPVLETLAGLGALRIVEHRFVVYDNPNLRKIDVFGALESVEWLVLSRNPQLTQFKSFPLLRRLDTLEVSDCDSIVTLEQLDVLLELRSLLVEDNLNLEQFNLRRLTGITSRITVTDNPKLPTCLADQLVNTVFTGYPTSITIHGNDNGSTCDR